MTKRLLMSYGGKLRMSHTAAHFSSSAQVVANCRPARPTTLLAVMLLVASAMLRPLYAADPQAEEQTWQLGNYVAYANAVRTDFLTQEVADRFDIERSNEKALITVSVQTADGSAPRDSVEADVRVTANRPSNSAERVEMRTHRADDDIYYLGVFPIRDREPISFDIAVTPASADETYRFVFKRYFFTD